MNLKKMVISSIAALSIMGGSAFAADNSNGTKVALDGTGDYLVYPYYAAVGSWKTNIRVVNTNIHKAIVAKVVIRERKTSAEKRDFLIYLTPGDVWDGELVNENGQVVLKTNDDSFILPDGTSAKNVPQTIALVKEDQVKGQPAGCKEDNTIGYVEIIGIAEIDGQLIDPYWVPYTKLNKDLLRKNYLRNVHNNTIANAQAAGWEGVDADSLTGQEVLFAKNQYGNLAMTLNATALEGVTGSQPNTLKQIGADTSYATMIIPDGALTAADVINNMSTALHKEEVYVPFYDNGNGQIAETALVLTMPMKKYHYQVNPVVPYAQDGFYANTAILSPMDWKVNFAMLARDTEESSTKPPFSGGRGEFCNTEICAWDVSNYSKDFTNGYARLKGTNAGIPVAMTAKNIEGTNVTNIFYPSYRVVGQAE